MDAELVDSSTSGFRLRYKGAELRPGNEVLVLQRAGRVRDMVIWTAIIHGNCESGFYVLSDES